MPPVKGRVIYWDQSRPGFGLMITAKGHQSYVIDYRANGRKRCMHLKPCLSLTDARREAKAILGAVAKGGDPLSEKGSKKRDAESYRRRTLRN